MPPGAAVATQTGSRAPLRLVPPPRMRIADVALFYGERSGGIRTYLDAKRTWAARSAAFEHHVITPHDVPSLRFATPNGYRIPVGVGALKERLRELEPEVVLLHDPFWSPLGVTQAAHELGARVVAVHHGSVDLDAAGIPLPGLVTKPALRLWFRHAYRDADAIMSAVPTVGDVGRPQDLPLRFGLEEAFRPRPAVRRGDHVLYVGRLAREKGVLELLEAAALAREPWPLRFVGSGPLRGALEDRARRLGIAGRVSFAPFVEDRDELSATYAAASAVVMPGAHETFGLVGFEAAASGARVVCCRTAPSRRLVGDLAHTYWAGDVAGLARAIACARATEPDHAAAWRLVEQHSWPAALRAEHAALARLCKLVA
jgi:alpha-1,6-mannosyltransferase